MVIKELANLVQLFSKDGLGTLKKTVVEVDSFTCVCTEMFGIPEAQTFTVLIMGFRICYC